MSRERERARALVCAREREVLLAENSQDDDTPPRADML
jgi:hypothetical protein